MKYIVSDSTIIDHSTLFIFSILKFGHQIEV